MKTKDLRKFTVPDYLGIFRLLAAAALVVLAILDLRTIFSWLLVLGLVSDWFDGFIARKQNIESSGGAKLDSAADVTIFLMATIGLIIFEKEFFSQYIPLLVFTLALYFLQLILAYWKYGQATSFHSYSAKIAAVVQSIFFIITSFFGPWEWLFYIVIAISILETTEEIIILLILKKPKTNVKGIYWVLKEKY